MVKKLAIIREIFKEDHNAAAAAARKLRRNQISALSGMLNYTEHLTKVVFRKFICGNKVFHFKTALKSLT